MRPRADPALPALALALCLILGCAPADQRRPSVLLFVVDTLRADALGAYGNPQQTPNVDRLAAEGVLFERAYSAAAWTRPSMAALLTGRDADAIDMHGRDRALPDEAPLLAELFRAAGYSTAAFAANPNVGSFYGFGRGFEEYVELYERRDAGWVDASELVADAREVADHVLAWLDVARDPFFLLVFPIDPHGPYLPPARFDRPQGESGTELDREHGRYLGEVAFVDHELGRVLAGLEARGLYDRTLVAFTSDHGEEFAEHGGRGHGSSLFDEVIRVPLILRLPGVLPSGERVPHTVQAVDVAPTLLALAGLPVPEGLDGRPLLGARAGTGGVYASLGQTDAAWIDYPWKLVLGARSGGVALFNLEQDPAEKTNLAGVETQELERMLAGLRGRHERNAGRREALEGRASVPASGLSREARRALEVLGYLDPEAPPREP